MKLLLPFIILIIVCCVGCASRYSKANHIATRSIGNGIYNEVFKTYSGGALAGDSCSDYVTDSINFRIYVGTAFHDDEQIHCQTRDGEILVYKVSGFNFSDTLEKNIYKIRELISNNEFE